MNLAAYRDLIDRVESSVKYWLDVTGIEFIGDVARLMDEEDVNGSELARRINRSQPYVSKALNGNANFQLKTMVRFAQALGAVLHVRLTKPGEVVRVLRVGDIDEELDHGRVYGASPALADPKYNEEWPAYNLSALTQGSSEQVTNE